MIKIAVDGFGGDHAPSVVCEGSIHAVKSNPDLVVVLTGKEDILKSQLDGLGYAGPQIVIHHCPDLVAMDESPAEVLKLKQNSSLVQCVGLQKAGKVDASVSAGNSGAMMAACLMLLGRVGNISRPAIACSIPLPENQKVVVLDCGANVDEKPQQLVHFAICGNAYAKSILGKSSPKIGLLNIGEEEKKGPESVQETYQLLKKSSLNFIGNVEGRDLLSGHADVVVTPGYTGNVVLKLMEGFYEMHQKLFGEINTPAGKWFTHDWNYSNTGGAMLLGLNGTGIITHGRADAKAIQGAIATAYSMAKNGLYKQIGQGLEELN